jgi:hypothetical protein
VTNALASCRSCSAGGFEHFFRAVGAGDGRAIAEISQRFGYKAA